MADSLCFLLARTATSTPTEEGDRAEHWSPWTFESTSGHGELTQGWTGVSRVKLPKRDRVSVCDVLDSGETMDIHIRMYKSLGETVSV